MFTISSDQMRHLATYHDTLGGMLLTLAFHVGFEDQDGVIVEPRDGWTMCDPGPVAKDRYGDTPLQGYTQEGSGVVVTLAKVDGQTHIHAEGDGWALETDGPYSGWAESGHYAHRPYFFPAPGNDHEAVVTADPPYHFHADIREEDNRRAEPVDDRPSWLKAGFDWDAQVATDPSNSLSRIHVLAGAAGVAWEAIAHEPRPTHAMMNQIETAFGIETTEPGEMTHRLTLGERISAAEAALAERCA